MGTVVIASLPPSARPRGEHRVTRYMRLMRKRMEELRMDGIARAIRAGAGREAGRPLDSGVPSMVA